MVKRYEIWSVGFEHNGGLAEMACDGVRYIPTVDDVFVLASDYDAMEKALGALLARADEHWTHKGSGWKEQDDARALLNNNPTVYDK